MNDFVTEFQQLTLKYRRIQEEASALFLRQHSQLELDEIFLPANLASADSRCDSFEKMRKLRNYIELLRSYNAANMDAFIAEVGNIMELLPRSVQEELQIELKERSALKVARYEKQFEAKLLFIERTESLLSFIEECTVRCFHEDGYLVFENDEDFKVWEDLAEAVDQSMEMERAASMMVETISAMASSALLDKILKK
jgi:hypothetical protein